MLNRLHDALTQAKQAENIFELLGDLERQAKALFLVEHLQYAAGDEANALDTAAKRDYVLRISGIDRGADDIAMVRSPNVTNFPSMLDVTAAGHLKAGETVKQGIREAEEELGIKIPPDAMHPLGYRVEVADQSNGQKNREYQAVFLASLDIPLQRYNPDPAEVYGILGVSLQDALALFSGTVPSCTGSGIVYDPESTKWKETIRTLSYNDFLARIQQYYLTMSIMADRPDQRSVASVCVMTDQASDR
ncbi:unnamed protein product [Sphagnum jensenii]|uniref:Nudix hydrolase domain-containing protein n=1 Tax=Sphagnum jensenii TaxID=128206 RepID=A0ABP0VFM7_9BRYO